LKATFSIYICGFAYMNKLGNQPIQHRTLFSAHKSLKTQSPKYCINMGTIQ